MFLASMVASASVYAPSVSGGCVNATSAALTRVQWSSNRKQIDPSDPGETSPKFGTVFTLARGPDRE